MSWKDAVSDEIFGYLKTRIGRRFLAVFLIISLVPLSVMRWMAIRKSEAAIQDQTLAVVRAASDGAEAQLREFVQHLQEQLLQIAQDGSIQDALRTVEAAAESEKHSRTLSILLASRIPSDVQEVFVLTSAGRVLASSANSNVNENLSTNEFFARGRESFFAGDVFPDLSSGKSTWIMAAPIKDLSAHNLLGVAAFRINPGSLSALTTGRRILSKGADTQSFRIGETGETYIVNRDGLMITESRYMSNSVLRMKVDTMPVRIGLERGQEITGEYKDYRGIAVTGSSVVLRDPPWILVTEIDFRQAFAPIKHLRNELIVVTIGLIFLAIVFAWSCTWRVIKPIRLLSESDRALAERDETAALVSEKGLPGDEIGELVRQRNARVKAVFDYQRLLETRTAKLQEMVSEIEHISYAIVHDMRAPLRAMQGFANLLESDSAELTVQERKHYLRNMSAAAIRLDQLITDVLTYNRTVLRPPALHTVDVDALLRGILYTYPDLNAEKADITIEGRLPPVIGNEALLTQCLSNILDNSIKFATPGTRPCIRIWSENAPESPDPAPTDESVIPLLTTNRDDGLRPKESSNTQFTRIWIEDNGIGIPRQAQRRLFRMFQRLTADDRGTGIGLAIVHKVVEQMGGRVGVQSELGKGSRFWIEFQRSP